MIARVKKMRWIEMRKMIGIFATLIIALGMSGVAFAHWSETLYINGTVSTGELDAEWSVHSIWDSEPDEKNVSGMTYTYDPATDPYTLNITINNAYPCIDYYAIIDIHNTGTIPLHIWDIDIDTGTLPDGTTLEIIPIENIGTDTVLPLKECTQLHKCQMAYGILHVHLDQDAEELKTYTFSITVEVVQWNYTGGP